MKNSFTKSKGSSLIQVISSIAIMSVVILGITTMISDQDKSIRSLSEKIMVKDLQANIKNVLLDPTYCSCVFRGKTFNTGTNTWSAGVTSLPMAYSAVPAFPGACTAAGILLPAVGTNIPGSTFSAKTISISSISEITPGTGKYTANFEVEFQNTIRSIRGIESGFMFLIDVAGGTGPTDRPFLNCNGAAVVSQVNKGFCTPRVDWDNSNTLPCNAISGFSVQRIGGNFNNTYRSTMCCYIPNSTGSSGWCSDVFEGWYGDFIGCGAGTGNYQAFHFRGMSSGVNDTHQCCFIPTTSPNDFRDVFSTKAFGSNDMMAADCGGPYADYDTIYQNVVTGGSGRNVSCTFLAK